MSDRELEEEVARRRRMRAAARRPEAPITDADRQALRRFEQQGRFEPQDGTRVEGEPRGDMAAAVERADLARHYAALELKPGATLAQVQAAYREMVARYSPDKHAGNPEKHRAATQLVSELTRSLQILTEKLSRR
jgi:hypothetical protein